MENYDFTAGTAVLTGAASGMGEQMAHQLVALGSDVVLLDRDAERLQAVADAIRAQHPERLVETRVADLADVDAVPALAAAILDEHPDVTLLVNNAGVALGGTFDLLAADEFDWVMDINFRAPVALTRAFLPTLLAHPGSHVVNVSSLFGIMAPAGQTAYASSKFALRGFSEALRHELAAQGVGVTCVHPGGIRTRIAETARVARAATAQEAADGKASFAKLLTFPADKAAAQILEGVAQRKPRVLIGISAVVPDLLTRLFPSSYMGVLARLQPGAMRNATRKVGDRV
jgi:short-subunit dehydrogenase